MIKIANLAISMEIVSCIHLHPAILLVRFGKYPTGKEFGMATINPPRKPVLVARLTLSSLSYRGREAKPAMDPVIVTH